MATVRFARIVFLFVTIFCFSNNASADVFSWKLADVEDRPPLGRFVSIKASDTKEKDFFSSIASKYMKKSADESPIISTEDWLFVIVGFTISVRPGGHAEFTMTCPDDGKSAPKGLITALSAMEIWRFVNRFLNLAIFSIQDIECGNVSFKVFDISKKSEMIKIAETSYKQVMEAGFGGFDGLKKYVELTKSSK